MSMPVHMLADVVTLESRLQKLLKSRALFGSVFLRFLFVEILGHAGDTSGTRLLLSERGFLIAPTFMGKTHPKCNAIFNLDVIAS
jgi:hypothetical protein